MRTLCLLLLVSGCVSGGEEQEREDDSFYVGLVRWQATLADETDAGSGCVVTNYRDSTYGEQLVVRAEPGSTVTLTETFERFITTTKAWSAHVHDDSYWCGKSGAGRWASVRNPSCFEPFDPETAPGACRKSDFTIVDSEVLPPGNYANDRPYVFDADGFRLTLQIHTRGAQCLQDCDLGQRIEFVVE